MAQTTRTSCWRRCSPRRAKGCCKRCGQRLWNCLPARLQEWIKPYYAQLRFGLLCVGWALDFIWEDRYEILQDVKDSIFQDMLACSDSPPCTRAKVRDELRPFKYMLVAAVLYCLWDMSWKAAWSQGPPMDMTLH
eukprot:TRINITY_DN98033_c0_g1_i1.p1 TRINITY_DN98033_c0_g1~~TRINITY_DN98033_c0_g1_i1.p1  ORF type:complete len:135 (-),score=22.52 TRINITY_DN98033_c0_g1_i1:128-532(-)